MKKLTIKESPLAFHTRGGFDLLSFIRSLSLNQRRFIFKKVWLVL
ncbi:unnamed protein product [Bacillus thuringiensis DB27]|uniref:Uncharacterized protein n=1 Tax=Bacillus thuringiensis DB27 TaxID=1431339 RepID=W8YMK4_BACTU|nr:unnamed protein product [Bacillus thuringiensis DB27]